jgi:hypothetical protein
MRTIRKEVACLLGEVEYVYGFPLVLMDVTRQVMTATAESAEYKAPINQFGRIRTYVNPDFKDVVRISVNSLWSNAFLDLHTLQQEFLVECQRPMRSVECLSNSAAFGHQLT